MASRTTTPRQQSASAASNPITIPNGTPAIAGESLASDAESSVPESAACEEPAVSVPMFEALLLAEMDPRNAVLAIETAARLAAEYALKVRRQFVAEFPTLAQQGPYRVTRDKAGVFLGGSITTVTAGTRVDARTYGEAGVRALLEQGVPMELLPVEETTEKAA